MGSSCPHLRDRPFPHPDRPVKKTPGSSFPSPDWSLERGPGAIGARELRALARQQSGAAGPVTAMSIIRSMWGTLFSLCGSFPPAHPVPLQSRDITPTPSRHSASPSPQAEILGHTGRRELRDSTHPEPPSSARLGLRAVAESCLCGHLRVTLSGANSRDHHAAPAYLPRAPRPGLRRRCASASRSRPSLSLSLVLSARRPARLTIKGDARGGGAGSPYLPPPPVAAPPPFVPATPPLPVAPPPLPTPMVYCEGWGAKGFGAPQSPST